MSMQITLKKAKPIVFSADVWRQVNYLVGAVGQTEIAWLGTARDAGSHYFVDWIYVPDQEACSATVDITEDGVQQAINEVLKAGGSPVDLRYWGHSQHTMGVTPSSQDYETADKLASMCSGPFVWTVHATEHRVSGFIEHGWIRVPTQVRYQEPALPPHLQAPMDEGIRRMRTKRQSWQTERVTSVRGKRTLHEWVDEMLLQQPKEVVLGGASIRIGGQDTAKARATLLSIAKKKGVGIATLVLDKEEEPVFSWLEKRHVLEYWDEEGGAK